MKPFFNNMGVAVIKGVMARMNQEDFIETAKFVKGQAMELPIGTRRDMFVKLYGWSRIHYKNKFTKKRMQNAPLFPDL